MKNILAFLFIFVLASCGVSDRPSSNTDFVKIIGKPIILKNMEIAEYNFPTQMNWDNANEFCKKLGPGWRLPNIAELEIMYQNNGTINGGGVYWSSTESDSSSVWVKGFYDGITGQNYPKTNTFWVRAIRAY
jgi:hypothetical protein